MYVVDIARVVHEANRALQVIQNDPTISVSPHWDDLDVETQLSAVTGVIGVIDGNTPEESHAAWCDFKVANGWIWGTHKDEIAKTHPLLVPYDNLPPEARVKDELFVAIVRTLSVR